MVVDENTAGESAMRIVSLLIYKRSESSANVGKLRNDDRFQEESALVGGVEVDVVHFVRFQFVNVQTFQRV